MITDTHINYLLDEISHHNCEKSHKMLFVQLHERRLRFAHSIRQSNEDAEEEVSDCFINIWHRRKSLATLGKPMLYFFVSVKNNALNKLKANKRVQLPKAEERQVKPHQGKKVLIVSNDGNTAIGFNIGYKDNKVLASLPAGAVATYLW